MRVSICVKRRKEKEDHKREEKKGGNEKNVRVPFLLKYALTDTCMNMQAICNESSTTMGTRFHLNGACKFDGKT